MINYAEMTSRYVGVDNFTRSFLPKDKLARVDIKSWSHGWVQAKAEKGSSIGKFTVSYANIFHSLSF